MLLPEALGENLFLPSSSFWRLLVSLAGLAGVSPPVCASVITLLSAHPCVQSHLSLPSSYKDAYDRL